MGMTCRVAAAAWLVAMVVCGRAGAADSAPAAPSKSGEAASARWYRGALHFHSFWSDGDDFPEMAVNWYRRHGFDFVAPTEHNVIASGVRWRDVQERERPIPQAVIDRCQARFGPLEFQQRDGRRHVRLRTLDEVRRLVESPEFLMIAGEEITSEAGGAAVHLNAFGLSDIIAPIKEPSVLATLRRNVEVVARQAASTGRSIVVQVNHPSWPHYDISAEDLAGVDARLVELCNASEGSNRLGDAHHPTLDRLWDITTTLRITQRGKPPFWAAATDDAHHYHEVAPDKSNPGRAWVMVRATSLASGPILGALAAGDCYASTGVYFDELAFDAQAGTLTVAVRPQGGAEYTIDFFGTPIDYDRAVRTIQPPPRDGKPVRPVCVYAPEVGKRLASVRGVRAVYRLTGKELFVRAAVRSSLSMPNPPKGEVAVQEAWTQPFGWQRHLRPTP